MELNSLMRSCDCCVVLIKQDRIFGVSMLKRNLSVDFENDSTNDETKKPKRMETPPSQNTSDDDDASDESSVWAPSDYGDAEEGGEACEDDVGGLTSSYCTRSRGRAALLHSTEEDVKVAMDKADEEVNNESDLSSDTESDVDDEEEDEEDDDDDVSDEEEEEESEEEDDYSDDDSFVTSDEGEEDIVIPSSNGVELDNGLSPATLVRCNAGIDPCEDGGGVCE